jgi:hypothetical protein
MKKGIKNINKFIKFYTLILIFSLFSFSIISNYPSSAELNLLYMEIDDEFDVYSCPFSKINTIYTTTRDYIVIRNYDFDKLENKTFSLIDKYSREISRISFGDLGFSDFTPNVLSNNLETDRLNNIVLFSQKNRLLYVNISSLQVLEFELDFEILLSLIFNENFFFLTSLNDSIQLRIFNQDFIQIQEFDLQINLQDYKIYRFDIKEDILLLLCNSDSNELNKSILYFYDVNKLSNDPKHITLLNNVFDITISKELECIYLALNGSIDILNLNTFLKLHSINLNKENAFEYEYETCLRIRMVNNTLIYFYYGHSRVHFMKIVNTTQLTYLGYISDMVFNGLVFIEIYNQTELRTEFDNKLLISTNFELFIVNYDLNKKGGTIVDEIGFPNFDNMAPILIFVFIIFLGFMLVYNRKKKKN